MKIKYRKRRHWLYSLASPVVVQTMVYHPTYLHALPSDIITPYYHLDTDGVLTIKSGYAWDGPSGKLTLKTKSFMLGSLVHDCLYQMMREGHLPREFRAAADREMRLINKQQGMFRPRVYWTYGAVRLFGGPFVKSDILTA